DHLVVAEEPGVASLDAEHVPPAVQRRQHCGTNDRVQTGRVAAARGECDSHAEKLTVYCCSVVTARRVSVGAGVTRWFQCAIALSASANVPCVSCRQSGLIANDTTCPLPSGASITAGRPAS